MSTYLQADTGYYYLFYRGKLDNSYSSLEEAKNVIRQRWLDAYIDTSTTQEMHLFGKVMEAVQIRLGWLEEDADTDYPSPETVARRQKYGYVRPVKERDYHNLNPKMRPPKA
jgi:hypothetical protein